MHINVKLMKIAQNQSCHNSDRVQCHFAVPVHRARAFYLRWSHDRISCGILIKILTFGETHTHSRTKLQNDYISN